ncbi:MAG TPA: hypothetical protein VFQ61_17030 [Polyangiaceae bacterium]|nr:hypothetical protein [Polyangiaceae bacterium]
MSTRSRFGWQLSCATLVAIAFASSGCRGLLKKRAPVEGASATPSTTTAPLASAPLPTAPSPTAPLPSVPPAATAAAVTQDADLPTPQDFEEDAFEKITAKNLQAELTRLSKEIGN